LFNVLIMFMISIHDHETIIFYTVTTLMIIAIFALVLILIYSFYNDYRINIKNITSLPETLNLNFHFR
jgi:hypothetical protein